MYFSTAENQTIFPSLVSVAQVDGNFFSAAVMFVTRQHSAVLTIFVSFLSH